MRFTSRKAARGSAIAIAADLAAAIDLRETPEKLLLEELHYKLLLRWLVDVSLDDPIRFPT